MPVETQASVALPAPLLSAGDGGGEDVEAALLAAFDGNGRAQAGHALDPSGSSVHDEMATRELFASIASNHARPVKNFISELRRGNATKEWIEICRPVLGSIMQAAESMELSAVTRCLADFDESLTMAQNAEGASLGGESRELILSIYEELSEILPDTFVLGEEDDRREAVILHSLLRQIPGVGYVTMEKLYGVGLTSLDSLFLASKEDLAVTTGVPEALCEQICSKIRQHRDLQQGRPSEALVDELHERLVELVHALRRHHDAFRDACEIDFPDETTAAVKREARCSRQGCALQINVVLAEMGEVELVEEVQKLAFERRVDKLESYLAQSRGISTGGLIGEAAQPAVQPRV